MRRDTIAGAGVSEEVSVVTESEPGDRLAAEYRISDDGRVVEIRLGEAIVARPEAEATARRLDKLDLFALARVALPRALPRDVPRTIVYRLKGLPPAFQKSDARQRFEKGPPGSAVLVVSARRPAAMDPAKDTPLERARAGASPDDLAATPQVNFEAPAIAALAKRDGGRAPGGRTRRRGCSRPPCTSGWRRSTARATTARATCSRPGRATAPSTPSSSSRSRARSASRRGRCTGSSTRSTATRRPALYWHAWPEVRSAGEWIPLDPTFGQPVADATHVALGSGTQVDTVGLLGTLQVLGVEVRDPK